ncbi:nucleotide pyrophosphohydrolase [Clostridia bacterium]|nr:nucleotide pyrophosphohydrolase [Clostridia bacterium]
MDQKLIAEILRFRDDRDWKQFHNPKDLAISLSLEAAELLENFQWSTAEEAVEKRLSAISEELADVVMYSVLFADAVDLDIGTIVKKKLELNADKYPVDKAFGKKNKYTEF